MLFLSIVAILLLRRLYINCKLTGAVAFDLVFSSLLLFYVLRQIGMFLSADRYATALLAAMIVGLCSASLERFCVGFLFHCHPVIEEWHESFHEQLRMRKISKLYLFSDHASELISYVLLFSVYYAVSSLLLSNYPFLFYGWWLGLLLEHYVGAEFRLHVQYSDPKRWERSVFRTFYHNIETYYWYHLLIDRQQCLGFSTPFWDALAGRHPFSSRFSYSTPLPFVDFFFVQYTAEYDRVQKALVLYREKVISEKNSDRAK